MGELENLNADRTNICLYHYASWGRGLDPVKLPVKSVKPYPYLKYFIIARSKVVRFVVYCSVVFHSQMFFLTIM